MDRVSVPGRRTSIEIYGGLVAALAESAAPAEVSSKAAVYEDVALHKMREDSLNYRTHGGVVLLLAGQGRRLTGLALVIGNSEIERRRANRARSRLIGRIPTDIHHQLDIKTNEVPRSSKFRRFILGSEGP